MNDLLFQKPKKKNKKVGSPLRQPLVWSVSDVIFLASAYEGGWWPVSFLAVSSSHR